MDDLLHGWISYTDELPWMRRVAEAREKHKQGKFGMLNEWASGSTHLIGIIGEWRFGLAIGKTPDLRLLEDGDSGSDFGGIDVKCSTFLPDPDMKVKPTDFAKGAFAFALVVIHQEYQLACYPGWAYAKDMQEAPLKDYGYGPMRALNWRKLRVDIP